MAAQMIAAQIKMKILGIGMQFFGGGSTPAPAISDTSTYSSAFANPNFFTNQLPGGLTGKALAERLAQVGLTWLASGS